MRFITTLIFLLYASFIYAETSAELTKARDHLTAMEYSEAAEAINQHLAKHKNDTDALHLLAKTYAWDNNYKRSAETYSKLLTLDPKNPEYLFGKGSALVWLQDNNQAIPYLDQAWRTTESNANYLKILILTLKQNPNKPNLERAKELSLLGQQKFPNLVWD